MPNTQPGTPSQSSAAEQMAAEAYNLRRKVLILRRILILVLAMGFLFMIVAWQRTAIRCRECREALQHYADLAIETHLSASAAETLEAQWLHLPRNLAKWDSIHYYLIPQNWRLRPAPKEMLPMAICRHDHVTMLARGRHVLYLDDQNRMVVKWITNPEAEPILAQARTKDSEASRH